MGAADQIDMKMLSLKVPGLESDPELQYLARHKALAAQNDIDTDSVITQARHALGLVFPRERALAKRQDQLHEEYLMERKAQQAINAELTKAITLASAMAPERLSQLAAASPDIARMVAPGEAEPVKIDPRAASALGQRIAGINVADVINPNVIDPEDVFQLQKTGANIIDRPLRQDERIRAGTLLEKQASGSIAVPGQTIELPVEAAARQAGIQHIALEKEKQSAANKKYMQSFSQMTDAENKLKSLIPDRRQWTLDNPMVKMVPALAEAVQLREQALIDMGYMEKGQQATPLLPEQAKKLTAEADVDMQRLRNLEQDNTKTLKEINKLNLELRDLDPKSAAYQRQVAEKQVKLEKEYDSILHNWVNEGRMAQGVGGLTIAQDVITMGGKGVQDPVKLGQYLLSRASGTQDVELQRRVQAVADSLMGGTPTATGEALPPIESFKDGQTIRSKANPNLQFRRQGNQWVPVK